MNFKLGCAREVNHRHVGVFACRRKLILRKIDFRQYSDFLAALKEKLSAISLTLGRYTNSGSFKIALGYLNSRTPHSFRDNSRKVKVRKITENNGTNNGK